MQDFTISPVQMIRSMRSNWSLIASLVKRDVIGRYRGSYLGILWSFFNPFLMLAVYTFFFSVIFKARWSALSDSKSEFALVLFAGLIVFNLFAECATRAPGLVIGNVNYVKKVVFPLEILPCIAVGSALFHALLALVVWLLAYMAVIGLPHATVLLFPMALFPVVLLALGVGWILASLGVFLRDVSQIISVVVTALMFLSPIFFPVTALPAEYRGLLAFNPMTVHIEAMRDLLYWGKFPDGTEWLVGLAYSALVAAVGFAWFQKTRKGFADVL